MSERLVVVLLTFNCRDSIRPTVAAARRLTDRIVVVDSLSTDGTPQLLAELGCTVLSRPFVNYADQRNWSIEQLGTEFDWQLHLDADEVPDDRAIAAIRAAVDAGRDGEVYVFERRTYFLGRPLRFGGATNYHLRLFRSGTARCENRLYDQHFVSSLPARRLPGRLDDMNVGNLTEWTARHNRWSSLEARELHGNGGTSGGEIAARLSGDPRERRRLYKGAYYRAPRFARAFALFAYRYVVQLGFLDGRAGFLYAVLQTFWFRLLVDAKLVELENGAATAALPAAPVRPSDRAA